MNDRERERMVGEIKERNEGGDNEGERKKKVGEEN